MSTATLLPPAFVVLAVALVMPFVSRRVGHALGVLSTGGVAVWSLLAPAGAHLPVTFLGFDAVLFNVDEFSRLMGIIFGLIGAAAVLYSYSSDARNIQTAYALGYVGTSLGAVFAGDWLTMVFFWELMAVTSTLLVWDYGGEAVRAGYRYAIAHGLGGSLLMGAIVWHYVEVGSFLFSATGGIAAGVPAALAALGIGVNVGYVGLHTWLPDTYPRPHFAASVFLSVYTTKTGVYGLARAFPDGNLAIAYMGTAMAVVGVGYALMQNDMRRLLAYHIQSQVGYMVAGVGIGTALATAGAFAHVYNHILYKALLFMTAGVVLSRTGEENLKYLGNLRGALPATALAFTVAALSISGFPGFNGFVSKGMITAAAHKEHLDGIFYLLLAGGVGTFMSFIKFGYYAFFRDADRDWSLDRAGTGQSVAMLSVAGLCVAFGLYPDALFAILPGSTADAHPFTLSHLGEGFALAVLGVVGFVVVKKPLSKVGDVPDVDAVLNPAVFYGTRALVRGSTGLFAAVDRVVSTASYDVAGAIANPYPALRRVAGGLGRTEADSITVGSLRATIATSIALVVLILGGVLVGLLA
ncbi:Na(+)/H(+) antiporter subunit D [Haloferax sp. Atlit-6N]|uniref:Monovalent cation/H+ antiporter subunit D n=1 Tax=Haloferax gibbonsii (strain ATCC 33959 / DSM 4427 / JCM 8863 / NBRC 102184 / NCIMB 2188 / Ma 2.38) TaxID=1227459 RepID=M0GWK4_HALGM|nr:MULTISPECIES: Na(+)/H(+) antiporter subunit D [Haloferax]ELZ76580.1 monovalent cation/H+ antiporter subunit D [Haloferax gibbonsii ATCC 33959]RDZ55014.1 Na(+)/H(+) antiporter subunit D [Haloferax sp. Atlit-4N]REA05342.1 Na(+)/H(+) antiporter subunit D [Haloferax sp. Atlit-6N]